MHDASEIKVFVGAYAGVGLRNLLNMLHRQNNKM